MTIGYLAPLGRAWQHTREMLFRPFSLTTWLVLGFSAWLAGLMDGASGGGFPRSPQGWRWRQADLESPFREAWTWISQRPHMAMVIATGVVAVLMVMVVLLWISSRGKFVFLDNVVQRRARVVDPWQRYRHQGTSLFLWRLGFFFVVLALVIAAAGLVLAMSGGVTGLGFGSPRAMTSTVIGLGLMMVLGAGTAYVALFLDSFVVPLMAREGLSASAAWAQLLPWVEARLGVFVLYGLFVAGWWIVVGFVVAVVGLLTCCVGYLVVMLPYVGTVALLPVWVTYRAFSLEFLAQFDPRLDLLAASRQNPAPAEVTDPSPSPGG